jgi:FkbM family methyltransferase
VSPRVETLHERVLAPASDLALRLGIRVPGADPIRTILRGFARATAGHAVMFVQIGSNDGVTSDPLRGFTQVHGWSGVLVEPVPYVFSCLRQMRGSDHRIRLENAAIADHDGESEFFHLRQRGPEDKLPEWYDQIGSFSLQTILSHEEYIPRLRDLLVTTTVKSITFESLCAKYGIERFDLLHIDTEGYDWEILRRIDLDRHRPTVVLYEHSHLTPQDRRSAQNRLESYGYAWHELTNDTIGIRHQMLGKDRRLGRLWRQVVAHASAVKAEV